MTRYTVNNCTVETLLSNIRSKTIAIPEIQRPFVWENTKVRDLIDSLYQGYPVGYIIEWQNPDVKLKDGSKSMGKRVLIDGQQRVTAMAAAIVGQEVVDSHYKKKRIYIAFNPLEEKFEVRNSANMKNPEWISDISEVFKAGFDPLQFLFSYCTKNNITEQAEMSKISQILTRLKAIDTNNLGVITLSHDLEIDKVTEIFIRINSKGAVLSNADFAMSKISSNEEYGGNITRKTIDYFCHIIENPGDFSDIKNNDTEFSSTPEFTAISWAKDKAEHVYTPDYTDVLRVAFTYKFRRGKLEDLVSLLSGRDFEQKDYKIEIEEDSFKKLHDGVMAFVNKTNFERYLMILDSIGIVNSSLIRSKNVINFGYILYLHLRDKKVDANIIEKAVRRWVMLSILTTRYSASPESMFDYDIKRFAAFDNPLDYIEQVEAAQLSDAYWNFELIQRLDTAVSSSPFFLVFLMAQIKANDRGFLSEHIEVKSMITNRGDIHHLFPKNYLIKCGLNNKNIYNQIANYVYLQTEINIKIQDDAPCEYMKTVYEQCKTKQAVYGGITDEENLKKNLAENCLPDGFENMAVDDYQDFLAKRRILMAQKIRNYYESLK